MCFEAGVSQFSGDMLKGFWYNTFFKSIEKEKHYKKINKEKGICYLISLLQIYWFY